MSGLLNVDDLSPEEQLQAAMGVHPAQLSVQNHIKGIPSAMDSVGGAPANGFVGNNENPLDPRTLKTVQPPAPSIAGPSMPGERPAANLPGVTIPKPSPVAQDLDAAQTERKRLLDTGSGVSQIGGGHGFWHGLAKVGDVAGSIIAPSVMSMIPGTEMHHNLLLGTQNNRIANDIGQQKEEAGIAKTNAEAENLQKPDAITPKFEKVGNDIVQLTTDPATGKTSTQTVYQGTADAAKDPFQLWQQQHKGEPVENFLQAQRDAKPDKENEFQAYYKDFLSDNGLVDSAHNRLRARTEFAKAGQPFGQQHLDIAINAQNDKHAAALDKKTAPLQQSIDDAQQAHTLADMGNKGNAEADVDLALSFFKTMRSGGAGIRFTRQEQDLIMGARSSASDLQALAQKVIGQGQKFTPEQRKQILDVIDVHAKAANMAMSRIKGGGGETTEQPTQQPATDPKDPMGILK